MVGAPTAGQGVPRETIHPAHRRLVAAAPAALVAGVRGDANHAKALASDAVRAVTEMPNEGLVRATRVAVTPLRIDAPNTAAAVREAALRPVGQAQGGAARLNTLVRAHPSSVMPDELETSRGRFPRSDARRGTSR